MARAQGASCARRPSPTTSNRTSGPRPAGTLARTCSSTWEEVGADRVLFRVDCPHETIENCSVWLDAKAVGEEENYRGIAPSLSCVCQGSTAGKQNKEYDVQYKLLSIKISLYNQVDSSRLGIRRSGSATVPRPSVPLPRQGPLATNKEKRTNTPSSPAGQTLEHPNARPHCPWSWPRRATLPNAIPQSSSRRRESTRRARRMAGHEAASVCRSARTVDNDGWA